MTPTSVTGLVQTLPAFSGAKQNTVSQDETASVASNPGAQSAKDSPVAATDTVSISELSRQAVNDVKKEQIKSDEAKREKARNDEAARTDSNSKSEGTIAKVQFVYDLKGELSVRYLDTSSRLIYQVPSELMLRLRETAAKADSSVNTSA